MPAQSNGGPELFLKKIVTGEPLAEVAAEAVAARLRGVLLVHQLGQTRMLGSSSSPATFGLSLKKKRKCSICGRATSRRSACSPSGDKVAFLACTRPERKLKCSSCGCAASQRSACSQAGTNVRSSYFVVGRTIWALAAKKKNKMLESWPRGFRRAPLVHELEHADMRMHMVRHLFGHAYRHFARVSTSTREDTGADAHTDMCLNTWLGRGSGACVWTVWLYTHVYTPVYTHVEKHTA